MISRADYTTWKWSICINDSAQMIISLYPSIIDRDLHDLIR